MRWVPERYSALRQNITSVLNNAYYFLSKLLKRILIWELVFNRVVSGNILIMMFSVLVIRSIQMVFSGIDQIYLILPIIIGLLLPLCIILSFILVSIISLLNTSQRNARLFVRNHLPPYHNQPSYDVIGDIDYPNEKIHHKLKSWWIYSHLLSSIWMIMLVYVDESEVPEGLPDWTNTAVDYTLEVFQIVPLVNIVVEILANMSSNGETSQNLILLLLIVPVGLYALPVKNKSIIYKSNIQDSISRFPGLSTRQKVRNAIMETGLFVFTSLIIFLFYQSSL